MNKVSINEFVTDDIDIEGEGLYYNLIIGYPKPTHQFRAEFDKVPTWKEFCDDAIDACKKDNVCLSYLCEQGMVRIGGPSNPTYRLPKCAQKYIADALLASL